jgi:hypothetical protein
MQLYALQRDVQSVVFTRVGTAGATTSAHALAYYQPINSVNPAKLVVDIVHSVSAAALGQIVLVEAGDASAFKRFFTPEGANACTPTRGFTYLGDANDDPNATGFYALDQGTLELSIGSKE